MIDYCGFIITRQSIRRVQFSVNVKILLVHGDIFSWVTGLMHYNARQFNTLFKVHGDANSWVRVTHEIHEHLTPTNNDDSTIFVETDPMLR